MSYGKKKSSASRAASKQGTPLGLIIALALAGGAVLGSAGTYLYFRPLVAAKQSAPPVASATPGVQTVIMPNQAEFKPAPQPPGEAPPGKVWSVEHGHWHDAPVAQANPVVQATAPVVQATPVVPTAPAPAPATVTPAAATTPAPEAVPKKE
jgi:hypothetical protein